MENSRNFSGNTVGNNATVNQGNVTHIMVNADTSDADKTFLQEICKTDPVYDKKRILTFKGPLLWESFNWILGHQEFHTWRHTKKSGVFWIKGDPGKGKTMLLCGIIEDLENDSQSANLSYFFCQATDYRLNTAAAVVGGLIKSLLKRHPTLLSRIRENYEDGPRGQLDGVNGLVILCDIFENITKDSSLTDTTCVVDALDECIKDCSHLLQLIIKTSSRVKWLLSSRNEKDVEKRLDQVPQRLVLELKQNAEQISASIDTYISHHIRKIEALKDDEELQAKALDMLKSKAQGTFLWVALVVEQLHSTDHWRVEDVLEDVPEDLESLYGLILGRTEKLGRKGREACQVLLSIVTTAKRPLHLQELLVFINSHWRHSKHFKNTYELRDVRDIAKDCGSILSIREDIIYFIHQSAKDYILENEAQHVFPIQHQHYKMFEASLDTMSSTLKYNMYDLEDFGIHIDDVALQTSGSDPLASIRYCCVFWVEHLVSGYRFEGFEHQKYIRDDGRLHSFLKENFLCWIESLVLMRSFQLQAQAALGKLKDLIEAYCRSSRNEDPWDNISEAIHLQRESEAQGLRQFIDDAYRFVVRHKTSVAYWPLQLYVSAMSFEQDNSTIRKIFERTVRDRFGPSPILASVLHSQSSFRLQTLFRLNEFQYPRYEMLHYATLFPPHDSSLIGRLCCIESTEVLAFWRIDTGSLEFTFQMEGDSRIAFAPNSNDFISVSQEGIMKRWSFDMTSCIGEQSLHLGVENTHSSPESDDITYWRERNVEGVIALSPKGDLVASLHRKPSSESHLVKVWDTNTAHCDSLIESGKATNIYAAFSPNSELLALEDGDGIRIHNAKTGVAIQHVHMDADVWDDFSMGFIGPEECCIFSPNSKFLVTAESKWQLCLWDTETWELIHRIEESSQQFQNLRCLAVSPDSAILATGSNDGTKLWSIDTAECVAKVTASFESIAFPFDWTKSSLVASQQAPGTIQIWLVDINQAVPEVLHPDCAFDGVTISPDSKFVASRRRHRSEVNIWRGDGQLVHVLKGDFEQHESFDYPPTFSPDSDLMAYAGGLGGTGIQIWRVITGESVRLLKCQSDRKVSSVAFSSDPKHLVASKVGGEIYIWCIDSGQLVHKYHSENSRRRWFEGLLVAISPDSAHVASYTYYPDDRISERVLGIWHMRTGEYVDLSRGANDVEASHYSKSPSLVDQMQMSFSFNSAILASVTASRAQIFDVATGACLQSFALGVIEHPRLMSFDPIKGQIFTAHSVLHKTSSWEHWQTSPRLGYSYDYHWGGFYAGESGTWILLDGKKNCYVPSHFRPETLSGRRSANVAMSDSLLAVVNEVEEVVIIKFPSWREARRQAIGTLDVGSRFGDDTERTGNSGLVTGVSAMGHSGSRRTKRRRVTFDE